MPAARVPVLGAAPGRLTEVAAADALAVPLSPGEAGAVPRVAADVAAELTTAYALDLAAHVARVEAKGAVGEVHEIPLTAPDRPARSLFLLGTGDGGTTSLRRAGAALARAARGRTRLAFALPAGADDEAVRACAEGLLLASYVFSRRSEPKRPAPVQEVELVGAGARRAGPLAAAAVTADAVVLARDLANTPSNEKDPAWLAARAEEVAASGGLRVRVWDERELAAGGFGGILAVGAGSARPPRLVELGYTPAATAGSPHVVLVGKGITFDSGGLSLKPAEGMVAMKTDMAAGGAVIAVLGALSAAGVRARVTALVPLAENLPGAAAQRPGDVITHYGGRTVEVLNTDAEGRLVLADALAYADTNLAPDVIIDLATLTGAAALGLGRRHGALYTADEALAAALARASADSGEPVWRLPLVEDYRASLDSDIADLSHIARDPTISGGSITAALFLREFVGARRWAHLDIAGPARAESDEHEVTKGATGYGVRLLLRWLETLSAA